MTTKFSAAGKRILLIDDDPSTRLLLGKVLTTAGCLVDEAESVREALDRLRDNLPDLVLLDLGMPEHNGFQFLQLRAKHDALKRVPVIVLSGETNSRRVALALGLGADHFIEKPFRAHLVLQKIGYVLFEGDPFVHVFPRDRRPEADAEIPASLVAHSSEGVEVLTTAQLDSEHAVVVRLPAFEAAGGSPIVARAPRASKEAASGEVFRQRLRFIGVSAEEREKFSRWRDEV